jgi:isoleucyl-tRNA synthetase
MDLVFERLTAWLAPQACFTMEEAWATRFPGAGANGLRVIPETPEAWRDDALAVRWEQVRDARRVVTGALEVERRDKRIGASLEATPDLYVGDPSVAAALDGLDLAEIAITSTARLVAAPPPADAFVLPEIPAIGVVVHRAEGRKCDRCWQVLREVGEDHRHPDLCRRCADAVGRLRGCAA